MGQSLHKIKYNLNGEDVTVQLFSDEDGSIHGYCFSRGVWIRHPLGDPRNISEIPRPERKSPEQIQAEIAEVEGYQVLPLDNRKLSAEALAEFGVRVAVSEVDGVTPELVYYPYKKDKKLVGYKVKLIPKDGQEKRMWSIGELKDVDFFGWELAKVSNSKRIIITEGEDDAISLRRILERYTKPEWKDSVPAVVSLPHGAAAAARDIGRFKEALNRFKEVILCFDDDEAGRKAVEASLLVYPTALSATLPCKDANECLVKGHAKAAFNAVMFNAVKPKNSRLVLDSELHEVAKEVAKFGELTWPWDHLNQTTRGIRYGETIYIGAGVKMGKGEVRNALAAHFIEHHKIKCFVVSPEESNKKTYKLIAGKIVGKKFHDPEVEFDEAAYEKAGVLLRDKLALVNLYQHLGWETLKQDIISAVGWGAKAIFIDPITNLTNGIDSGEANTVLQGIAQDLAAMALDYQVIIFIFCHLKAPDGNIAKETREKHYRNGHTIGLGNCPHELGGDVNSAQFAGSRAMMRSCNMMLGLEGNKDNVLEPETKNLRDLVLLEDREFGETGRFRLYWNPDTTQFVEIEG